MDSSKSFGRIRYTQDGLEARETTKHQILGSLNRGKCFSRNNQKSQCLFCPLLQDAMKRNIDLKSQVLFLNSLVISRLSHVCHACYQTQLYTTPFSLNHLKCLLANDSCLS